MNILQLIQDADFRAVCNLLKGESAVQSEIAALEAYCDAFDAHVSAKTQFSDDEYHAHQVALYGENGNSGAIMAIIRFVNPKP